MSDTFSEPLTADSLKETAKGRPADSVAMILAAATAGLSIIGAVWFFVGFAENDTRPEHLTSAFSLTLGMFSLAIVPFAIVAFFARRASQHGGLIRHYIWTLLLMIPWIIVGSLSLLHAPLPKWSGLFAIVASTCLTLWALVSLILDLRSSNQNDTQTLGDGEQTGD